MCVHHCKSIFVTVCIHEDRSKKHILDKNNCNAVNFVLWRWELEMMAFAFSSAPLTFDKSFQLTALLLLNL